MLWQNCTGIIQGNIMMNNSHGIIFENYSNPEIRENIITLNGIGILCAGNSLPKVHWNDIYDNHDYDMINEDQSVTVNAIYNYWGDSLEGISGNVLYNPWLTESTLPFALVIESPQSGMTVGLALTVKTQVSDLANILRVEFHLQGVLVHTAYETPFQWTWDTAKYPNGEYTITAKAYDNVGNMKTHEITVTVENVESPWWQTHFLTIIEVLVAICGLILGIFTVYTARRKKERKKE